ncbi:MAG TPA: DUF4190 domain-containing protein [Brevefilum fermentans]|jgi:hypothetical protein|uniref:Putative membrane protein n=1 Tax=Candidatus Brevifilum fermentans TaxID=1986204 RepID=A0A1Y6K1Y5_9CHLR
MTNQGYSQPPIYQQTSTMAVISLISGIASFFILPLLGAILAIILGYSAKKEIAQSGGALTGEGLATWGLILGWVNIGLALIGICLSILVFAGVLTLPFCFIPFANGFN